MLSFFPLSISLLYYCFLSQNFPLTVSDLNCLLYRLDSLKAWFTKTFPLWMAIPDSFHWSKIPFKKSCISNFFSTSWFPLPPPQLSFLFSFYCLALGNKFSSNVRFLILFSKTSVSKQVFSASLETVEYKNTITCCYKHVNGSDPILFYYVQVLCLYSTDSIYCCTWKVLWYCTLSNKHHPLANSFRVSQFYYALHSTFTHLFKNQFQMLEVLITITEIFNLTWADNVSHQQQLRVTIKTKLARLPTWNLW